MKTLDAMLRRLTGAMERDVGVSPDARPSLLVGGPLTEDDAAAVIADHVMMFGGRPLLLVETREKMDPLEWEAAFRPAPEIDGKPCSCR